MFQQIDSNKNYSILLVVACSALLVTVGYFIGRALEAPWYVGIIAASALATVLSLTSYFGGGKIVLSMSGARKVRKPEYPQLFNVVEEMAIAGGLPMPDVYVIDDSAPNAFATGRKPEEAAVAVTSGLLSKLNRDELQGVIAHEMSHIRNYDILFMMLMAVMVGTIALLCDFFRRSVWHGAGRSRSRGKGNAIIFLVALLLAILAPIVAKLIQLAASRRREYLADASGALLTRYPAALASALRKIASDPEPLEAANRATQHLYIVNPIKPLEARAASLLSTHPPIEERIRRLEKMAYIDESDRSYALRGYAGPSPPAAAAQPASTQPSRPPIPVPIPVPVGSSTPTPPEMAAVGAASAAAVGGRPVPEEEAAVSAPDACPRCHETLVRAKLSGRELRACRACGGVWIGTQVFTELVRSVPHRLIAADDKWPNLIGVGWNRVGPKRCPQCGMALGEAPVKGVEGVTVDRCMQCDGVWFDDGELAAIVSAAQRRGTGTTA
jgi:heat shock protein HtpX